MTPRKKKILDIYGKEPRSLQELGEAMLSYVDHKLKSKNNRVVGLCWDVRKRELVSNTHQAPEGKPTNWSHSRTDLPKGYPGYAGRIWFRFDQHPDYASYTWSDTLTYTGTGGYGGYGGHWEYIFLLCHRASLRMSLKERAQFHKTHPIHAYSYDFCFFSEDWPGLEYGRVFDILKGSDHDNQPHRFKWEDADTVKKDAILIAECKDIIEKLPEFKI
jgi:hypothetical protein